jgi:hypothetical protein
VITIANIDADIVTYRNAASCEAKDKITGEYVVTEPLGIAFARVDKMMRDCLHELAVPEYQAYLSGGDNFRYAINPQYKATRPTYRPQYLQACREYLVTEWGAKVTEGYEADDAVGMAQTDSTILCSNDKDLNMIPGEHYNFIKKERFYVTEMDGIKAFYRQMLIGDTSDNIIGIRGIGPVKASKLIDHLESEEEMFKVVTNLYDLSDTDDGDMKADERFWMNVDCLWIWRKYGETFSERYANKQTTGT